MLRLLVPSRVDEQLKLDCINVQCTSNNAGNITKYNITNVQLLVMLCFVENYWDEVKFDTNARSGIRNSIVVFLPGKKFFACNIEKQIA